MKSLPSLFLFALLWVHFTPLNGVTAAPSPLPLRVSIVLTVDWEGETLLDSNILAMRQFNQLFPHFPVVHFLNAAYYTKKKFLSPQEITQKIQSVIKPNDELGLHVHAWEELVRVSGVSFRSSPTFWGDSHSLGRGGERGDDVPLNEYTTEEIYKILKTSIEILNQQGFQNLSSFRAGGWMSGERVQKALLLLGLYMDSSAVPADLIENQYDRHSLLVQRNKKLWSHISPETPPFVQKLSHESSLIQASNNYGLADYLTADEFYQRYLRHIQKAREQGMSEVYINFGWHQESAHEYYQRLGSGEYQLTTSHFLDRVIKGLHLIQAHAREHSILIVPRGLESYHSQWFKPERSVQRYCAQVF